MPVTLVTPKELVDTYARKASLFSWRSAANQLKLLFANASEKAQMTTEMIGQLRQRAAANPDPQSASKSTLQEFGITLQPLEAERNNQIHTNVAPY